MSKSSKKDRCLAAIKYVNILEKLSDFSPVVVSTILVGFDTDDSDIDIVCSYTDAEQFKCTFEQAFAGNEQFFCETPSDHSIGRFSFDDFVFEVFASRQPVMEQNAYRHFKIMERLSTIGGEAFRKQVRVLKEQGLKTEPALANLLSLHGDPYQAVFAVERWTDDEVRRRITAGNT